MEDLENYDNIVVTNLINYIEENIGEMSLSFIFEAKENEQEKIIELFENDQRIRSIKKGWITYYVILDNNKLLTINYDNFGKEEVPTRFRFSLHNNADKCYVLYVPNPGAYSNHMLVMDSQNHEINNIDYNYSEGGYSLDVDFSNINKAFIKDLINPTSIEQMKERARKTRRK